MIRPKITVGIPNYNGAKYLRLAIESVLKQTFRDFELILSDDGSTDESRKILQEYESDPRVKIIFGKENKGLSYRLNEQINLANGEYFCRMDSDDIMMPYRLERQYQFMKQNPESDVIGSSVIIIGSNNEILGSRSYITGGKSSRNCNGFIHPTVFGKLTFFKKYLYSEKYSGVEDQDLWIRSCNASNLRILNEPLLYYRDPLEIKLTTYIFRLKLIEKLIFDTHKKGEQSRIIFIFTLLRNRFQRISIRLLYLLGASSIWVKRRNKNLSQEAKRKYQTILDETKRITHSN